MADLFDSVDDGLKDLFDGVQEPTEQPKTQDPEAVSHTARLAALSDVDHMAPQPEVVATLEAATKQYEQMIRTSGDEQIRLSIAKKQQERELAGLQQVFQDNPDDPELLAGVVTASRNVMAESEQKRKEYALEKEATDKIQALAAAGDHTQAKVLLNVMEMGNAEQVIRDNNVKKMILQREIANAQFEKDQQGWGLDVVDFFMSAIPLNYSMGSVGNVNIDKSLTKALDNLLSGKRVENEAATLWNLPPDEFAKMLRDHVIPAVKENSTLAGFNDKTEQLQILTHLQRTPNITVHNVMNVVDNVGLLPSVKTLKGAASIPAMMMRLGARKEAGDLLAKTAMEMAGEAAEDVTKKTGVTADDVVQGLAPSTVNVDGATTTVNVAGDALAKLERGKALVEELIPIAQSGRWKNTSEMDTAINTVKERLNNAFPGHLKDVKAVDKPLIDGSKVTELELTFGKAKGGGFASQKSARTYMNSLGYNQAEIVKDESGQWFGKVNHGLPETGFYSNTLNVKATNAWSRRVLNARNVGDQFLADVAQLSGNSRNLRLKELGNKVVKPIQDLKQAEREALSQVLHVGEQRGVWWSKDERDVLYQRAFGRLPSDREELAYQAVVDANDIEYALRNDEAYKMRFIKGFSTVSFENKLGPVNRYNALVTRDPKEVPTRAYNVTEGIHYNRNNPLTPQMLERLRSDGYVLVKLEQATSLLDGTEVQSFLIKAKDLSIEALRRDQVAYRAGGHRLYKGKYLSKQAVIRSQPDEPNGRYFKNPNTYIIGETKAEVDFWTNRMEEARLALLDGADAARIDDIFDGHVGFPDGEDFIRMMENGDLEKNVPFRTLYDRELPVEYIGQDADALEFVDPDESGFDGFIRTTGRMYYGRKGENLPDWQGAMAPTVDPFETVNRALNNIANISSFSDYKATAVERWVNTFKNYMDNYNPDASALKNFSDAQMVKGGGKEGELVRQQAIAQKQIIERTLGWKTDMDRAAEQHLRNGVEYILGDSPTGVRHAVAKEVTNWFINKNPAKFLRGLAFDSKLGFFNPRQIFLQTGTFVAAISMSPKLGLQGMAMMPFLRGHLISGGATEHYLEWLTKNGIHKLGGFSDPKDFKNFMRSFRQSGFGDFDGSHLMVNSYGPDAATSEFANKINRLRSGGRFFFNEGELMNRMVAWRIAWGEASEKFVSHESDDFRRFLAGRAEDYALSMSDTSAAWWQKGVLSIPTQFWAYNVRMLEAMLGKTFTPAQRIRLALFQSLLYGSAGLPFLPLISEQIKKHNGEAPDIGTIAGAMDRGLIDTMIYHWTGVDAQVGKNMGTGPFLTDTLRELFGFSPYGDKSMAENLGGATASILWDTTKAGADVLTYFAHEAGVVEKPMTKDALIKLASNISTVSYVFKSWYVANYGEYLSNKGTVISSGLPSRTAFATMLGFAPGKNDDVTAKMGYIKDKSETVKEAARIISNLRTRMANEPDNQEDLQEQISVFVQTLPPDIKRAALKKAHTDTSHSLWESLAKRMEKERNEQRAMKELAQ